MKLQEVRFSQVPRTDAHYQAIRREQLDEKFSSSGWGGLSVSLYESHLKTIKNHQMMSDALRQELIEIERQLESGEGFEAGIRTGLESKKKRLEQRLLEGAEWLKEMELRNEESFIRDFVDLSTALLSLNRHLPDQENTKFLFSQLRKMFGAPEVVTELRACFGSEADNLDLATFSHKVINHEVPISLLYRIVKTHQDRFKRMQEEAEQCMEEYKHEYLQAIDEAIEAGWLPVSREKVIASLTLVKARVLDKLTHPFSGVAGNHAASGLIGISSEMLSPNKREALRHTVFHEFTHEISGKLIQTTFKVAEDQTPFFKSVFDRKSGVSLSSMDAGTSAFVWLNEALTEWIALRLSGYEGDRDKKGAYKGSLFYTEERKELDRLFAKGLRERTALIAYCEDIDHSQPRQGKGSGFASLIKEIGKVEEDKVAFNRLENGFILHNVENELMGVGCYPEADLKLLDLSRLPPKMTFYALSVRVAGAKGSDREAKFFFPIAYSLSNDEASLHEESFEDKKKKILSAVLRTGRKKTSFTISRLDLARAAAD